MGLLKLNTLFLVVLVLGYTFAQEQVQLDLSDNDGSESSVTDALKSFLSEQNLLPGMSMSIAITPPSGSPDSFLSTVLQAAKAATTELLPNSPAQFNAGASKNMDGSLSTVSLDIHTATD